MHQFSHQPPSQRSYTPTNAQSVQLSQHQQMQYQQQKQQQQLHQQFPHYLHSNSTTNHPRGLEKVGINNTSNGSIQSAHRVNTSGSNTSNNSSFTMNRQILERQSSVSSHRVISTNQVNVVSSNIIRGSPHQQIYENKENDTTGNHSVGIINHSQHSSVSDLSIQQQQHPPKPSIAVVQSSKGTVPEAALQAFIAQQLEEFKVELVKTFEGSIQECLQKNQSTAAAIEQVKKHLGNSRLQISEVSQRVEDMNMMVDELRSIPPSQATFNEQEIAREIEKTVEEMFGERIESIERSQAEVKEHIEILKEDITRELHEEMNGFEGEMRAHKDSHDQLVSRNINQLKLEQEKKINAYFDQITHKISGIERDVCQWKEQQRGQPESEAVREEIYSRFDEYVRDFEGELMSLKAQIDSKLDTSHLQEVLTGYQSNKEAEIFNKIGNELESLEREMREHASEASLQQTKLEERINSFEVYVDTKLREVNTKLKTQLDDHQSASNNLRRQDETIQTFERNIQQLHTAYEKLSEELSQMHVTQDGDRNSITRTIEEITRQLSFIEAQTNKQSNATLNQHQTDSKIGLLDREIHALMGQMSQFQTNLDEHIEEHQRNIQRERKVNHDMLDQLEKGRVNNDVHQKASSIKYQAEVVAPADEGKTTAKYDDYLKKYEDFHQEVTTYLGSNPYCNTTSTGKTASLSDDSQWKQTSSSPHQYNNSYSSSQQTSYAYQVEGKNPAENKTMTQVGAQLQTSNLSSLQQPCVSQTAANNEINVSCASDQKEDVVYEMDEKGYLIDDRGNYILDDEGNAIQLSAEHIEYLKSNNMIQDDA